MSHGQTRGSSPGPSLTRLADAVLIPPFPGTTAPDWLLAALERGLAGVTLFGQNVAGTGQLAALTQRLHSVAGQPIIAIDEEGGDVTRLAHLTGSPYPGNAALGAADDTDLTMRVYRAIGSDLAAAGINLDLAPSVDVNTADDNPVIGTRAFGSDTATVTRHAAAAVSGLQRAGIAACAKHFPGHGSTREDTHHVTAGVPGGLDALWQRDLPPFQAAIAAGAPGIMTGHLRVPGLTGDLPATLSHAALTGLLRNTLGFRGVIVTDALEMRGAQEGRGIPEAGVLAVGAGADLLCLGRDTTEQAYLAVRAALVAAVESGALPASRLEEAAARVGELRRWLASAPHAGSRSGGDRQAGSGVGLAAARRAASLSGAPGPFVRPFVMQMEPRANVAVGAVPWGLGPWLAGQVATVLAARPDATVVEMGLPIWRPAAGAYLATYGAGYANCQAAAEILGLDHSRELLAGREE